MSTETATITLAEWDEASTEQRNDWLRDDVLLAPGDLTTLAARPGRRDCNTWWIMLTSGIRAKAAGGAV